MGRRKIEIEPIKDDRNRTVTFIKRKAGLFKKAHELSVLCQVDIAVIILGTNNTFYEYSSVDMGNLISVHQNNADPVSYTHLDVYKRQVLQSLVLGPLKSNCGVCSS